MAADGTDGILYQPRVRSIVVALGISIMVAISMLGTTKISLPDVILASVSLELLVCRTTVRVLVLTLVTAMVS